MKKIFETKFVNDELYSRNGEEIEIVDVNDMYCDIKFNDGKIATVYTSEVKELSF